MGYQALLFCPDEKTARTVTQVLSELDFAVVPCTEPFAAVKKLMAEHFDAVVVDCDNEQNATLLFKSARNTAQNQSSLAVAVVEGQAGVAKAFRIGANLVLTRPINVEQAKGTLRVARGLLRKSEAAKLAPVAGAAVKAAAASAAPPKPAPQRPISSVSTSRPATPAAPLAAAAMASSPTQKTAPQPRVVASVPQESIESDAEIFEVGEEVSAPSMKNPQPSAPGIVPAASSPAKAEPKIEKAGKPAGLAGFGTSTASAPAPAREPEPRVSIEDKQSAVTSEPAGPDGKDAGIAASFPDEISASTSASTSTPPSAFTFGGNVSENSASGRKKALLAVAVVVLIAALGYAVWMQWVRSSGAEIAPTHIVPAHAAPAHIAPAQQVTQPVTAPAPVPQVTPSAAPAAAPTPSSSSPASSADSSDQPSIADSSTPPHATGNTKTSSATRTTPASKVPGTQAAAQPIMIKSGSSRSAAQSAPAVDAPVPSITGIAPADSSALPSLIGAQGNAPRPILQTVNISQGVSEGLLLKRVQPVYPANALRLRLEGPIQLMATISKAGDISAVKILSGEPQLARAAVDAVKQWKYKPYLLNGSPVEVQTPITVKFTLPH